MNARECQFCRYFHRYWEDKGTEEQSSYGHCRRNAPRPTADEVKSAHWPEVEERDWCGEFVSK